MNSINTLKEPFPTDQLEQLDFGSADGRKDKYLEDSFVYTKSVKLFLQDRHSIIIGPLGSGKSALFELLKNKSKILKQYSNKIIVPIEEGVSFQLLQKFIHDEYSEHDDKLIYKLIWKFQIIYRICEEFSKLPNFSKKSSDEKKIKQFLVDVNSRESDDSIIDKLKNLLKDNVITATISQLPIDIGVKNTNKKKLNIDKIYQYIDNIISHRCLENPLVIIDRIDTFVAGQEYETQRKYIEALLEVNDDIDVTYSVIKRKIFLRSDLFARLNYEALGYDKVKDETLLIEWSDFELIYFLANRILTAFKKLNLLSKEDILLSTNLNDYPVLGMTWFRQTKFIPLLLKRGLYKFYLIFPRFLKIRLYNFAHINQERQKDKSLLERINKATVTKIFPRKIIHKDSSSKENEIDIFTFLSTHFKDGHQKATPRNLLAFLKQVTSTMATYYEQNPDQEVHVKNIEGDWEWELFKKRCVYEAYCKVKEDYIQNISKANDQWTKYFSSFNKKRGNKKTIDFNWMKSSTDFDDDQVEAFLAYLEYIGFIYISYPNADIKRRKYRIPIIYM
jgi:ABC-type branched-subunit amino acid transport system ATPase component